MSGREVDRSGATTMPPPRSAHLMPALRASSSRARMPIWKRQSPLHPSAAWERSTHGKADGRALHALSVLEHNAFYAPVPIYFDPAHSLRKQDVQPQRAHLLHDHAARIAVQLPAQHPPVPLDELHVAEILEVHHRLGGFKAEQAASHGDTRRALAGGCEVDEALQVVDGAVHEHALRVVARGVLGEERVRAGSQHEDIVGNGVAARRLHFLLLRVDFGDERVEVVAQRALGHGGVLRGVSPDVPLFSTRRSRAKAHAPSPWDSGTSSRPVCAGRNS